MCSFVFFLTRLLTFPWLSVSFVSRIGINSGWPTGGGGGGGGGLCESPIVASTSGGGGGGGCGCSGGI